MQFFELAQYPGFASWSGRCARLGLQAQVGNVFPLHRYPLCVPSQDEISSFVSRPTSFALFFGKYTLYFYPNGGLRSKLHQPASCVTSILGSLLEKDISGGKSHLRDLLKRIIFDFLLLIIILLSWVNFSVSSK